MLKRMAHLSVLGANPINAFAVRVGLGRRFLGSGFADRVYLFNAFVFLFDLLLSLVLLQPAHFLGDFRLRFVRIAVFIQQLHVLISARVRLLHELLVIVLVPFFLGVFLPALMLLDGLGELAHEIVHARGGLFGALRVLFRRQAPFGRGD